MGEISLFDYLRIIKKRYKIIILLFILSETIAMIFCLTKPKKYTTTITLMPPELIAEKGILVKTRLPYIFKEELPYSLYSGGTHTYAIISMIKSRRMAEHLVNRHNLANFYESETNALSKVMQMFDIEINKEGLLIVNVKAEKPELAYRIANSIPLELEELNSELDVTSVKPIVTVLDTAIVPRTPSEPKVKLYLLVSCALSLFFGVLLSFFIEFLSTRKKD